MLTETLLFGMQFHVLQGSLTTPGRHDRQCSTLLEETMLSAYRAKCGSANGRSSHSRMLKLSQDQFRCILQSVLQVTGAICVQSVYPVSTICNRNECAIPWTMASMIVQ